MNYAELLNNEINWSDLHVKVILGIICPSGPLS